MRTEREKQRAELKTITPKEHLKAGRTSLREIQNEARGRKKQEATPGPSTPEYYSKQISQNRKRPRRKISGGLNDGGKKKSVTGH